MTDDIAPELFEKITNEIGKRIGNSSRIKDAYNLITLGRADYQTAHNLAYELGTVYSEVLSQILNSGVLPDGKMYYNIAERTIRPALADCYGRVAEANIHIQKLLNEAADIGIKAIKPALNEDRIAGIVNKVTSADRFDDVAWVLDEPVKNFAQSIVDDSVRENADFQARAGLSPKITRTVVGNCCDWCRELAGTYDYPKVPKDIYRRHAYCRCMVVYDPGSGRVQNAHTKKWIDSDFNDKVEKRKVVGLNVNGVTIKEVSDHVIEQMSARNVDAEDIKDAILRPLNIKPVKYDEFNRPSFQVIGRKATIAINPDTGIATSTWRTSTQRRKALLKQKGEYE